MISPRMGNEVAFSQVGCEARQQPLPKHEADNCPGDVGCEDQERHDYAYL